VTHPDQLASDVAHAMLAAEGTGPVWGVEIEEVREGYARIRMAVRGDMLNGHGIVHGGMVFALADTAFAYACNGRNVKSVAAQASIAFLDAAREGETLVAEAREAALVGHDGVAHRDLAAGVDEVDGERLAGAPARRHAPVARGGELHAHVEVGVGDEDDGGGVLRRLTDPADQTLAGHHRHAGGHPVAGALVDGEDLLEVGGRRGDHPGGHRRDVADRRAGCRYQPGARCPGVPQTAG
jgi:acyl-CoA thioesterase